jgi:predicted metal-dependent RNase
LSSDVSLTPHLWLSITFLIHCLCRFEDVKADVLIMETTRGNRQLPPGFSREGEIERLSAAILRVLQRRGSVLIPASPWAARRRSSRCWPS